MKKSFIFVIVSLFLVMGFVSAYWPYDLFKKSPTGNVVSDNPLLPREMNEAKGFRCVDSDGGVNYPVAGVVEFMKTDKSKPAKIYAEQCYGSSKKLTIDGKSVKVYSGLKEYFCANSTNSNKPVAIVKSRKVDKKTAGEGYCIEGYFASGADDKSAVMSAKWVSANASNLGQAIARSLADFLARCNQTDAAKNPLISGSVNYQGRLWVDSCTDHNRAVRQYFCSREDVKVKSEKIDCPAGTVCVADSGKGAYCVVVNNSTSQEQTSERESIEGLNAKVDNLLDMINDLQGNLTELRNRISALENPPSA